MLADAGVMATDCMVSGFTCRVGEVALTPPRDAVTVALPGMLAVTSPVAETAIAGPDDFQVTALVRSSVLLSLNFPVAFNCEVVPSPSFVSGTVKLMEDSVALLTVKLLVAVVPPNFAVIVVGPAATVIVFPAVGVFATEVLLDVHLVPGADVRS